MTINLRDVGSGYKRTSINSNFQDIEYEINNNLISKNGGVGLEAPLDANSNRLINVSDGISGSDAVTLDQLNGLIGSLNSGLVSSLLETQKGSEASGQSFTFTSIEYKVGGNNLMVFQNGQKLTISRDYTETSSTSITLVPGREIGPDDDFDFITNTSTSTVNSFTNQIVHTQDAVNYNLETYLNEGTANIKHTDDTIEYNLATYLQNKNYPKIVTAKEIGVVPNSISHLTTNAEAIQAAVDGGAREIIYDAETYYIEYINLPHTGSYYRKDTGITHRGVRGQTQFTRGEVGISLDYSDEDIFREQCLVRCFGSYHNILDIDFVECGGAIFMGQDRTTLETGSQSWNNFSGSTIRNCGTAIVGCSTDVGSYFNLFQHLAIFQCQIGIHTRQGELNGISVSNFNRNWFKHIRIARCHIGLLMDDGDTNIIEIANEGNVTSPTNNPYTYPSNSITPIDISSGEGIGCAFGTIATNNTCTVVNEACDRYIIDNGVDNNFIGGIPRLLENSTSTGTPATLLDRDGFIQSDFAIAVSNPLAGYPQAAGVWNHLTPVVNYKATGQNTKSILEYGAIAATNSNTLTLQADNGTLANTAMIYNITLTADSSTLNQSFRKRFTVVARRNATRTISRYVIDDEVNTRVTGAGTSDTVELATVALSINVKDLELIVTAAAGADLDNVLVVVDEVLVR